MQKISRNENIKLNRRALSECSYEQQRYYLDRMLRLLFLEEFAQSDVRVAEITVQ
jgi:hypothetical protein